MKPAKKMVALVVLASVYPVLGFAANGTWDANHTCAVTSPARDSSARITLTGNRRGEIGGEVVDTARIRLFNIPNLTLQETAAFPNSVVEILGVVSWPGINASGRLEKSGYALYLPLPGLAQIMGPIERGRVLRITVQTKDGPQSFDIDLVGSAKAIGSFRACAT